MVHRRCTQFESHLEPRDRPFIGTEGGTTLATLALALVIGAALIHASWNLIAKRAGGGECFVFSCGAFSSAVWVPLAAWAAVTRQPAIGLPHLIAIAGSSVLHLGYFVFLHRGYRSGDLSLVYPLSRGVGPLLATAVAITFLGERPSVLALSGAALIVGGAFFLAGGTQSLKRPGAREAARYGIVTGVLIACYTLWDKWGVGTLAIPPLLYDWAVSTGRTILMAPYAMQHREEVREVFRAHWREAVAVAFLSPLSYIMVLTALATSPVSYVAPAREVSILVGTIMGARLLAEADGPRRMAAAAVMVIGVIGLALG